MNEHDHDYATLQQQWHGWGSPVGLGLGVFLVAAALAAVMAAASLF
jgi:hypothetical protein